MKVRKYLFWFRCQHFDSHSVVTISLEKYLQRKDFIFKNADFDNSALK